MSMSTNDNGFFEETNEQRVFSKVFYISLYFKFLAYNVQ